MKQQPSIAKTALAAAAGVIALTGMIAAPNAASAQPYGYDGRTYYDPCQRETTNRTTLGAVIGGLAGAAIGSNVAARNARTEGALLGGAVGAVGGGVVGNRSAACTPGYAPPPSSSYNSYAPPQTGYYSNDRRYYQGRYDGDRSYGYGYGSRYDDHTAYDRYGNTYPVTDRPVGADGCTLAESPILMPDGRTQKRFVRVCQDASGRYQVVD
jgi:hypothetical protein